MAAFLCIRTGYTISRVSLLFLAWTLRKTSSSLDFRGRTQRWKLPGSATSRFYTKLVVSVMIGYTLTIKLLVKKNKAKGDCRIWKTAKHSIEEKRIAAQNPTEAERADKTKSTELGSVVLWGYCAFAYTMALLDSREWLESVLKGSAQQERTRGWDMWCLWAPSFISGAVGMARWRYLVKTRQDKAQSEEEHVEGKEASEKLQV